MILELQIKSIFLCFIYGLFLNFTFRLNKKLLLSNNILYRIIINLLFSFNHTILFFYLLKNINNSILHIYYLPPLIVGILFYNFYFTLNKNKNWRLIL